MENTKGKGVKETELNESGYVWSYYQGNWSWKQPYRFFTYAFVHKNKEHLLEAAKALRMARGEVFAAQTNSAAPSGQLPLWCSSCQNESYNLRHISSLWPYLTRRRAFHGSPTFSCFPIIISRIWSVAVSWLNWTYKFKSSADTCSSLSIASITGKKMFHKGGPNTVP